MTSIVFTVGNVLRADDAAGPLLAERLEAEPAPGWTVIDGGQTPENHTHTVRALKPERVLVVDAAEMGLAPGEIRLIEEESVVEHFLITTHAIPLSFLIQSLRESVSEILFLGIQPKDTSFYGPVSPAVDDAVTRLHRHLVENGRPEDFPRI
ncbi:hydrogenase maturation peptidase HycI [Consotaella salsifontis]|uniref:Hydrogenase 3 maturation protease n=1 Tax=Consotaella salsifontis TaxID=1365950 RepID=A0A1T4RND5_9HYPH|nr:hydrogenase maturation peptidase HycI [Consotaella salsifontis]SKA17479.1 hydrogenase 3 maturation protease [Consotaella salsifontis]